MAKGLTTRQKGERKPCENCGLPHVYLGGKCPETDPEAFERAAEGWRVYEARLAKRRSKGRA